MVVCTIASMLWLHHSVAGLFHWQASWREGGMHEKLSGFCSFGTEEAVFDDLLFSQSAGNLIQEASLSTPHSTSTITSPWSPWYVP